MKKILVSLLCVLLLNSCITSQKSSSVREVRITNESSYELVFTDIDNGGDPTFWPQTSFTLQPHEEYSQICYNIPKDSPYRLAPVSMTLECDGKTIHFSGASEYEKNIAFIWVNNPIMRRIPAMLLIITNSTTSLSTGQVSIINSSSVMKTLKNG